MLANLTQILNFKHNFHKDVSFHKQNIIVQAEMLGDDRIFFRVDMTAQKLALTISVLSENSQFFRRLLFFQ